MYRNCPVTEGLDFAPPNRIMLGKRVHGPVLLMGDKAVLNGNRLAYFFPDRLIALMPGSNGNPGSRAAGILDSAGRPHANPIYKDCAATAFPVSIGEQVFTLHVSIPRKTGLGRCSKSSASEKLGRSYVRSLFPPSEPGL